jgi:hypothetical protein
MEFSEGKHAFNGIFGKIATLMVFSERENSLMSFSKFPLSAMLCDVNDRKEGQK